MFHLGSLLASVLVLCMGAIKFIYVYEFMFFLDWGIACTMCSIQLDFFTHVHICVTSTQIKRERILGTLEGFLVLLPTHLLTVGKPVF